MQKFEMTPLTTTVFILLFAIAVGTLVMGSGHLKISQEEPVENTEQPAKCDPLSTLKIRYINHEISEEEYLQMKDIVEMK